MTVFKKKFVNMAAKDNAECGIVEQLIHLISLIKNLKYSSISSLFSLYSSSYSVFPRDCVNSPKFHYHKYQEMIGNYFKSQYISSCFLNVLQENFSSSLSYLAKSQAISLAISIPHYFFWDLITMLCDDVRLILSNNA